MDFGNVIKYNDNQYRVFVKLSDSNSGYGVVPKTEDPINLYEIEDVKAYCEVNPSKVITSERFSEITALYSEKETLDQWLHDHDYIGVKIATGRATVEEYATEIALMTEKANRINAIEEELKTLELD